MSSQLVAAMILVVILFLRGQFQIYRARRVLAVNILERCGKLTGRELVACSMNVIPRGAVYVILEDLERQGLCTSAVDAKDPHRRRIYYAQGELASSSPERKVERT